MILKSRELGELLVKVVMMTIIAMIVFTTATGFIRKINSDNKNRLVCYVSCLHAYLLE